jgi:hypothetical protein
MRSFRWPSAVVISLVLAGCPPVIVGDLPDAAVSPDASVVELDAGSMSPDASVTDAGEADAGLPELDSGVSDSGTVDADAGAIAVDAGSLDAGSVDAGVIDAGPIDAGFVCQAGTFDCDADLLNGCESSTVCLCVPSARTTCYDGAMGTNGVGQCHAGSKTCARTGLSYGACGGQVIPTAEICADGLDQDCNGLVDDALDLDGDGFTACTGDCCDAPSQCANPAMVGPHAFEVPGNSIDDDCDGTMDVIAHCDTGLASDSAAPADSAKALGLCLTAGATSPGLINSSFTKADGNVAANAPRAVQHAIRPRFGTNNVALEGASLLVLSTGPAAAPGDVGADPNQSSAYAASSPMPADWFSANGSVVPVPTGCPAPTVNTAFDSVVFKVSLRVPANAHGFTVRAKYLTADYPESVCSAYVDEFVALLDSSYMAQGTDPVNPPDKNIAAVSLPTSRRLLGANLASGTTGYFSDCVNGATGCSGGTAGTYAECTSTTGLAGTGYETATASLCDANSLRGGATGWLTLSGNVVPNETITLRFIIWDGSDPTFDSVVLLDGFQWSTSNVTAGATP